MATFIGTKRVGRDNLSAREGRIAKRSPQARKIIQKRYVKTSSGKLALKPDPIGITTPKTYNILKDLAEGQGGAEAKKFASKALRQIQFLESTRTIPSRQIRIEIKRQAKSAITAAQIGTQFIPPKKTLLKLDPKILIEKKIAKKQGELSDFEKRIRALQKWEQEAALRSEKVERPFRYITGKPSLPFDLSGDTYIQKFGRDVLALPTRWTLGFGEQVMIVGGKIGAVTEGLMENKKGTIQALKSTLNKTPKAMLETLDLREPENLVNILGLLLGARKVGKAKSKVAKPKSKPEVKVNDVKVKIQKNKIIRRISLDWKNNQGKKVKAKIQQNFEKGGKGTVEAIIKPPNQKSIKVKTRLKISPLEKERIRLRREAKTTKKISKGLQVKAKRKASADLDGKKIYQFENIRTGKVKNFNSRKQWLKAVKRQEKFLKTKEGKKLLKSKGKFKRQFEKTKLERERIRLRREAKTTKKISKGLTIKAERGAGVVKDGKTVYPFLDKNTGKIRYFTSRKQWLKAVKQQVGKIKSKELNLTKFFKEKIKVKKILRAEIINLEKQRTKLRKEVKIAKKISKGLQVKAKRKAPVDIDGKKKYIFQNIQTKKTKYFNSRKQWFKAVKRQEKFLKTKEGKKLLKSKGKFKRQFEKTKLERERIRLRREAKTTKKISKGLQVKAERGAGVVKDGKTVYPFLDKNTGKIRYFTSRKQWLKAVKQQVGKRKVVKVNLGQFFKNKTEINAIVNGKIVRIQIKKPIIALQTLPKIKKTRKVIKKVESKKTTKKPSEGEQVTKDGLILIQEKKVKVKAKQKQKQIQKQKQSFKQLEKSKQKLKLKFKEVKKHKPKTKVKIRIMVKIKSKIKEINKQQSKIRTKVKNLQKIKIKIKAKEETKIITKPKVETKVRTRTRLRRKIKVKTKTKAKSKIKTKVRTKQKIKQKLKEKIRQRKKRKTEFDDDKKKKKVENYMKKKFGKRQFAYMADIASILEGTKATTKQKKQLLTKGRVFSGLERRPIV